MLKRLLVLCLLPALLGCGARVEVAKDKILAQVDSLLGEIDVKKKEAEIGVRNLTAAMEQYTRGKIEAKVKLKQVSGRLDELEKKVADADKFLGRLRDYLKAGKNVEISGKTYTPAQLKEMAEAAIPLRKKLGTEAEAFRGSKERLAKTVALLEQKEQEGRDKIQGLKLGLEEIEAKSVALESMKEASRLSGETAALDFGTVEKQVRDLSTKIDVELTFHDEKAKESSATKGDSLEAMIRQTSTSGDTVAEIDKLIGKL